MDIGNWSKGQVAAFIVFVLLIFSIPLGTILVKQSQIFNSGAAGPTKPTPSANKTATIPKEVPAISPVGELEKYLSSSSANTSPTTSPTPTNAPSLSFGPTLNIKINIEGRPQGKQSTKAFVGIAPGATASAQPKFLLSFTVDFPDSGSFDGLSLAGLDRTSIYTAYIKGPSQIDSAATFSLGPAATSLNEGQPITLLSGDLNDDNTINAADYIIAKALLGKKASDPEFNIRVDFNQDGMINAFDLSYITKNFGKTGNSGTWYSPAPTASSSAIPSTTPTPATGSTMQTGGYWILIP